MKRAAEARVNGPRGVSVNAIAAMTLMCRCVTGIALALASALLWGTGDFFGGLQAKKVPVFAVAFVSQAAGLGAVVVWVLASGADPPALWRLGLAALAGMGGIVALTAFYRGLAIGTMSIVAPISATGAAVPVLAGLASGESPSALQAVGMAAAFGGVLLASREQHDDAGRAADARLSVLLALCAAAGFGLFLALMKPAAHDGVAWAMLGARVASVSLVGALLLTRAPGQIRAARPHLGMLAVVGLFDIGANAAYAAATTHGLLSVVSVVGSLYPVTTVIFARVVLRERVRRSQEAGVLTVFAGVALIAAG